MAGKYRIRVDYTKEQWLDFINTAKSLNKPISQYAQEQAIVGVTDLKPSPDPANQVLPIGTTSTNVTFNAPVGDTFIAIPKLEHLVGSGTSLSGSGVGPYTISGLSSGDIIHFTMQFNGTEGDVVNNSCVIYVQ